MAPPYGQMNSQVLATLPGGQRPLSARTVGELAREMATKRDEEIEKMAQRSIERARRAREKAEKRAEEEVQQTAGAGRASRARMHTVGNAPEVIALGNRAKIVATGRLSPDLEGPFQPKDIAVKGVATPELLSDLHGVTIHSTTGNLPSFPRPNQDDFFFVKLSDELQVAAVFDGHGRDGHRVAAIARDRMMRHLVQNLPGPGASFKSYDHDNDVLEVLEGCFLHVHKELAKWELDDLDVALSGVSGCVVLHDIRRRWLYVAWAGNVRCMAAEVLEITEKKEGVRVVEGGADAAASNDAAKKKKKRMVFHPMTKDHTTRVKAEKERVEKTEAELRSRKGAPHEIFAPGEDWPGIPLTRCMGNLIGHALGVTSHPESVDRGLASGTPVKFLVIATDGVWDVLQESEVLKIVNESKQENALYGVKHVIQRARDEWMKRKSSRGFVDDITMCVIWF